MNTLANECGNARGAICCGLWNKEVPCWVSNSTFDIEALCIHGRASHSNTTIPWFLEEENIEVNESVEDGMHAHI
jgi:hypothetical protein